MGAAVKSSAKTGFNTAAVVTCALAAVAFLFALSLFLQGGFAAALDAETERKALTPVDAQVTQDAFAQRARLAEGYRWIDEEQGVVGMSIEDAKDALVRRYAAATETSEP